MPKPSSRAPARPAAFTPVATRARHDGWTPEKQVRFVEALAESGCVTEACAAVGLSTQAAYALRTRVDAQGFRMAWDAALDLAIRRLSDACYARALHGEAIPHYYQGSQVGEHRRYDNRLAMFLLRYRDPLRYAATLDQMVYAGHPEAAAIAFAKARGRVFDEAHGLADTADPADGAPPYERQVVSSKPAPGARRETRMEAWKAAGRREEAARLAEFEATLADDAPAHLQPHARAEAQGRIDAGRRELAARKRTLHQATMLAGAGGGRFPGDVPSSSSTSATSAPSRHPPPAPSIRPVAGSPSGSWPP